MRNAFFPHMEWAKTKSRNPLPTQIGFSGAPNPPGKSLREYASGHAGIERKIARRFGVPKDHVYLVGGTSLANFLAIAAFADPGERVLVETPCYTPLAGIPRALGCEVVDVQRRRDGRLARLPRARLLVVTNPHNPTGRILHESDWGSMARFAGRGGVVLVDEVYHELQVRRGPVAAARNGRFLTTGSFTKTQGLGALRLGWVLGAPELLDAIRRVDNLVSVQVSTPSLLELERIWPRLGDLRRKTMRHVKGNLALLRKSGLSFPEPQGGITAFVEVGDGDRVADALEARGVGVARGSYFGAPESVRVFLAGEPAVFRRGIEALVEEVERA